jgi:hypothetical protein
MLVTWTLLIPAAVICLSYLVRRHGGIVRLRRTATGLRPAFEARTRLADVIPFVPSHDAAQRMLRHRS